MKNTGERFKEIRQKLNFTQEEFGSKLGLSSQGISNIENNKSFLTLEKLQILKNFNINLNYLVYGEGLVFIETSKNENLPVKSVNELEEIMLKLLKKHGIINNKQE